MNRKQNLKTVYGKQKLRQAPMSLRTVNMETGRFDPSRSNLVVPQMVPLPDAAQQQFLHQQQQFVGPQQQPFPGPPQQQQFQGPPQQQQQFQGPPQQQQQFQGPPQQQQFQGPPPQQQQQFQGPPPQQQQQFQGPPLPVPHPFLQRAAPPHQFEPPRQFPPPQEPRHAVPPNRFEATPRGPFPTPDVRQPHPGRGAFNAPPPQPFPQEAPPKPLPQQQAHPPPPAAQPKVPAVEGAPPSQKEGAAQAEAPEGLPGGCVVPKASVNPQTVTMYPHTVRAFINSGGLKRINTKYQWSKVTVHDFSMDDAKSVFAALNLLYYPKTVVTYMHWVEEDNRLNFLMTNDDCKKLMFTGLKLQFRDKTPIELTVTPSYSNVQINQVIRSALGKRFDKTKRHLDLSYAVFCPAMRKIFFDLDEHPCGWQSLIEEGAKMVKELVTLSLAKNGLHYQTLEKVLGVVKTFQSLCVLDLSDNDIVALPVKKLQIYNVTEVSFTGNPLCAAYADPDSYISDLKTIFPSLTKVDETFLSSGLPLWRQTLVASDDLRVLADQFLEHFFRLYDGNRKQLRGLYHEDAVFSLSSSFLPGQSTSSSARLSCYAVESRNLLKLSDLSKAGHALFSGAEAVLGAVARLPQSLHDPASFTVDLPRGDPLTLTVTGVFVEPPHRAARYFVRTFLLVGVGAGEFQVANDVLYVTNATTRQAKEAFRHRRPPLARPPPQAPPPPQLSDCDKLQMAKILAQLTEMNEAWSYKCLDESQWDIKEALLVFSELLKLDRVPEAAFRKQPEGHSHPHQPAPVQSRA